MTTTDALSKKAAVQKIIQNHVYGAMGVGMIPVPLVDLIAISGVQLNMLRKLCLLYDIPFSKDAAKTGIATLLGGVIPVSLSGALASLVKAIPIVGQTTSAIVMPAVSGAMTYAVGKVFVQHFESGGTFLTFNPEEVRAYYQQMFEEGKDVASGMASEVKDSAPTPDDKAKADENTAKDSTPPPEDKVKPETPTSKKRGKPDKANPQASPGHGPGKKPGKDAGDTE
ncbi:MAG: DUF697 domain-containing protein [Desulfobacterium sp.]|nr:DUF697 domain-containing protein [Desulfobacterium sp.]